jgi:Cu(I)/Ag(I) efflux system protein CusF
MKLALAAAAALLVTGPALAQAPATPAHEHAAMTKTVEGVGQVKAIDAKGGGITLRHGPIAALSWPAMTMTFKATPDVLKSLKAGQTVTFTLDPASNQITAVRPK